MFLSKNKPITNIMCQMIILYEIVTKRVLALQKQEIQTKVVFEEDIRGYHWYV